MSAFSVPVTPDWQGFVNCILRKGTPRRVHFIELFLDAEVQEAICARFGVDTGLNKNDPNYGAKRRIALQRFLGYDYVNCCLDDVAFPAKHLVTEDSAELKRASGRHFIEEHKGPITSWEEFERYPWPDPHKAATRSLERYEKNLPGDMCVIAFGGLAHFCEHLCWLMGYETLCFALYDNRALVEAMYAKLLGIYEVMLKTTLQFERVKIVWGSDDMGFKSGTLLSPPDMRRFVLAGHQRMAAMAHAAGRLYILHACGKLDAIMDDLIDTVNIDGKHSFEDTIEDVRDAKDSYGRKMALLGGIDVDFLCRSSEAAIRQRVRGTLDKCLPGGGYCLGTGNSMANYIPVNNYLAMLDEGRRYAGPHLA